LGPTLSQNLLQALSDFRNTQDNFMSVWLNHRAQYMELLFDLGIIQFDDDGIWIEETVEEALARMALCGGWSWTLKEESPSGIKYLDRLFPPDAPENVPPVYLESIPVPPPILTPLSWFEEDLGLGFDPTQDADAIYALHEEVDPADEFATWESMPGPTMAKDSIFDRVRERLKEGVVKPKDPTANMTREEFLTNLYRVRELTDQGMGTAEIIKETGLPTSYVLAYQRAAENLNEDFIQRIKTPKPKSPLKKSPGPRAR
jgi:hypothetical protein